MSIPEHSRRAALTDDELDDLTHALLDGCISLHDQIAELPPHEQEEAAVFHFRFIEEMILLREEWSKELRAHLLALARRAQGNMFAAWLASLMARCGEKRRACEHARE